MKKDASLGICLDSECKMKHERLDFCAEHFEHFKFGVIRRDGTRPIDFSKKLSHYKRHLDKGVKK